MFKGKVKILFNYDNQTLNSRAAVFESSFRWARERLAKQDAQASLKT